MKTQSHSSAAQPEPVDPKTVVRQVVANVKQVDAARADGYAGLLTLRAGKGRALARREQLYTAKYGEKDPRVARAKQQREANERLTREIDVARTHAETPVPKVDENSYVLHGFVRDRRREPQRCLTLALYDEQGNWVRETDYATTNDQGYFLLRYQRPAKKTQKPTREEDAKAKAQAKAAAAEQTKTDPKQQSPAHSAASARMLISTEETRSARYQLRVYDAEQTLVHRDATPVQPRLNQVDFREVVIDREGCAPMPPPGGQGAKPTTKIKAKGKTTGSGAKPRSRKK